LKPLSNKQIDNEHNSDTGKNDDIFDLLVESVLDLIKECELSRHEISLQERENEPA
jgi:hypothetical protein